MNWTLVILAVVAVGGVLWFKRANQVGSAQAVSLLRRGAAVIDVRSPQEFAAGAVSGAVNIPLDHLREELPRLYPDTNQALLLHCLSGGRSMMACRTVRGLGYRQVHNLGSIGRARRLVEQSKAADAP